MATLGPISSLNPYYDPETTVFDFSKAAAIEYPWTYSRASEATYIDEKGWRRKVRADEPRFEMTTDGTRALLLERSSTNLTLQSDNPLTYTVLRGAMTAEAYFAGFKLGKYVPNTESSAHYVDFTAPNVPEGTLVSLSFAMREADIGFAKIEIYINTTAATAAMTAFRIGTGASGSAGGREFYKIRQLGDGVALYTFPNLVAPAGTGGIILRIRPASSTTGTSASTNIAFDNIKHFWIGEPQIETGGPSSYIATTAAQVTRASDYLGIFSAPEFHNVWSSTMVWASDLEVLNFPTDSTGFMRAGLAAANMLELRTSSSRGLSGRVQISNGGYQNFPGVIGGFSDDVRNRVAVRQVEGTYKLSANGSIGTTQSERGVPVGMARLTFGASGGNVLVDMRLVSTRFIRKLLTDAELTNLTK